MLGDCKYMSASPSDASFFGFCGPFDVPSICITFLYFFLFPRGCLLLAATRRE